jgi:predicted metalloendopeptidase
MNKSIKQNTKKNKNKNKTLKNKNIKDNENTCMSGLKPFEFRFQNKKHMRSRQEEIDVFKKKLIRFISPTNVTPQNDFYTYINYYWLKKASLKEEQRYITQIDDFRLVQDKVYYDLKEIVLDYIKSNNNKLSHELKTFYNSVVNMNSLKHSNEVVKEIIHKIDEIRKEKNGVWKLLAYTNENEIISSGGSPFIWSMAGDDKDPNANRSFINGPQLSILDMTVYYDDNTGKNYKSKMRHDFNSFVKKLFKTVLGNNHNLNTDDVYNIEVDIFNAYGCTDITSKEENIYNRVTEDEAITKYGFNWKEFSKELGFKNTPKFFITTSLNYLKCGTDLLLKNWDSEKWRTYWIWLFIKVVARMTKKWESIIFDFYGETERGQEKLNKSDAVSAALYMSIPFNTFFTNKYIEKYQNKKSSQRDEKSMLIAVKFFYFCQNC